jgi:hypothetical protein
MFSNSFLYQFSLPYFMRIWDIPTDKLCQNHLLGEHRELHAIWSILTKNKKGYSHHPETLRWKGKLKALYIRHGQQIIEMEKRGFNHKTPLEENFATGSSVQDDFIDSLEEQIIILNTKKCKCKI